MSVYAIRIDGEEVGEFVAWLEGDGGAFLVVRETVSGANPHMHAVLRSAANIKTLRVRFTRAFPGLVGNKSYSIAEVRDDDKYHRYLCKGESAELAPEVVGAYGLQYADVAWQDDQHAAYWEENARVRAKRVSLPMVDYVVDACKEQNVPWQDKHAIAKVYIRELVNRQKAINVFAVRASVNLVSALLCPDDSAIDDLAAAVVGV